MLVYIRDAEWLRLGPRGNINATFLTHLQKSILTGQKKKSRNVSQRAHLMVIKLIKKEGGGAMGHPGVIECVYHVVPTCIDLLVAGLAIPMYPNA